MHFHDLRGTAAFKFYTAGLSIRVIAEILAWSEDQVERIIRRYVGRWPPERPFANSMRPKSEQKLENRPENFSGKIN